MYFGGGAVGAFLPLRGSRALGFHLGKASAQKPLSCHQPAFPFPLAFVLRGCPPSRRHGLEANAALLGPHE